ncbi:uncharacterized protein DUF983 [Dyadobacter jejuensis]|uniref:Uncharacterized protein DUF983 n=1 Tax=Dyadobacter jejuensis TaxID=1082580 RepID=A0A316ARX1_9BACT|nr:DUF983 domain-containing protein [Dyadobacter jejuensis]PWJ60445.1 uncharacterized protein DUF983 [Dyadobacter jejuensis]
MTRLTAIVKQKCPHCRQGDLFVKKNPYAIKDALKMPERCPICQQDFRMEPGFYIGALWTSFPLVISLLALFSVLFLVVLQIDLYVFFVLIAIILFSLQPIIIRLGRAIWINVFVDYDPEAGEKEASQRDLRV